MKKWFDADYDVGDTVYLKTDPDQHSRMVFAVRITVGGTVMYELCFGTVTSMHYGVEISKEINALK